MNRGTKLFTVGTVWALILASLIAMAGPVTAEQRGDSAEKPDWGLSDLWTYETEDTGHDTYVAFAMTYTLNEGTNQYEIGAECRLTPTEDSSVQKYTLTRVNEVENEYEMTLDHESWENGTWGTYVTDTGGAPGVNVGDVIDDGTYSRHSTTDGKAYYGIRDLNLIMATYTTIETINAIDDGDNANSNDLSWSLTFDQDVVETTEGGPNAVWKPNWDQDPMKVGDTWKQDNTHTIVIDEGYQWGGAFSGGGSNSVTYNYYYDLDWQVASKSSKSISNTKMGTNNFPEAYKITRSGSYDWDRDDGTNQDSGSVTPGPYEKWYGADGDQFDGGWGIEYNQSSRLTWSTYTAFSNSPPVLTSEPEDSYDINEDEVWAFTNDLDYAVTDSDPDEAGDLTYSVSAELDGDPNVLTDLTIDTSGDISFTPTQQDVADGYTVTINVTDMYDKDPMSLEFSFTVNVLNTNDAPSADPTVMVDFELKEGEEVTPTWKLSEVFSDPDMEENPLNDNKAYDPDEELTFSVSNNGSIRVKCQNNGIDLGPTNQCDQVIFEAMDGRFPNDIPVAIMITATDRGGLKVNDQMTITVKHLNHDPVVIDDPSPYIMNEDETSTLDLKQVFFDHDVGDARYPTGDSLIYTETGGNNNIEIKITASKARMVPAQDWNGKETVTFTATDRSGARAELELEIEVLPINDGPYIVSVDPDLELNIDETDDGTEDGAPTEVIFSVDAFDVDQGDVLSYNWSVEDGDSGDVLKVSVHDPEYTFQTSFDGDLDDGHFHGGEASRTYIVTCTVTDGKVDANAKNWIVTVENVNRAPIVQGVNVSRPMKDGTHLILTEPPSGIYNIKYMKEIQFDARGNTRDPDEAENFAEGLDELTFEWTSDKQGYLGEGSFIDVGIGERSDMGIKLQDGKTHVITLRVSDDDGGATEITFTVKVDKKPEVGFIDIGPAIAFLSIFAALALLYRRKGIG